MTLASFSGRRLSQDGLRGPPRPSSIGCFTLSSTATTAEGLCLYNSGYLHWVRNPPSHTHTNIISPFHSSQIFVSRHCGRNTKLIAIGNSCSHADVSLSLLLSCETAAWKHQCNILIITWFMLIVHFVGSGNTTALFTTEMLAGFLFQRRFRGVQGSQRFKYNKLSGFTQLFWSCKSCLAVSVWEIVDVQDRQCWRWVWGKRTNKDSDVETWIFTEEPVCHSVQLLPNMTSPVYTKIWSCILEPSLRCIVCVNTTVKTVNQQHIPPSLIQWS